MLTKTDVDSDAVRAAGMELLRVMEASGFVALVARNDGRLSLVEIGAGVVTDQQWELVQAVKQLIRLMMKEGQSLFEESDPNDGKLVTLQ
jgi:protein-disulfide isomerase-like protein with CxxC motif